MSGLPYLVICKKKGLVDGSIEENFEFPGWFKAEVHRNFIKPIRHVLQNMPDDITCNFPETIHTDVGCFDKFTMSGKVFPLIHHQFYLGKLMLTKHEYDDIQGILRSCPNINDSQNLTTAWLVQAEEINKCSYSVQQFFSNLDYSHFFGFDGDDGYRILNDVYDVLDDFEECITMTGFKLHVSIRDRDNANHSVTWECNHSFITDETIPRDSNRAWESHVGGQVRQYVDRDEALIALNKS